MMFQGLVLDRVEVEISKSVKVTSAVYLVRSSLLSLSHIARAASCHL